MLTPTLQSIKQHLTELGYEATERYPNPHHIHDTIRITNPTHNNTSYLDPNNSIHLALGYTTPTTLHIDRYHQGEHWTDNHNNRYGHDTIDLNHPQSITQLEQTLHTWLK